MRFLLEARLVLAIAASTLLASCGSTSPNKSVALAPPISVSVSPATISIQTGGMTSITATVLNDPQNKGVSWSLSGAGCSGARCGTLSGASSPSGTPITYTAPGGVPSQPAVSLTATSISNNAK